jgi:inorganic pyrophosphatase
VWARFTMLKVMVDLHKLPVHDKKGDVYVVVETPRGSAAKLEFDPDLQLFTLSKSLILGLSYPYDWGFIPSTEGEDGDPIDALILHDAATTPGLVLKVQDHRRPGSRAN